MDFNTLKKILESFQKHPKRTILILCIMVLVTISTMFFSGFFSELGKKTASDRGAKSQEAPRTQIGQIKTGDQSPVIVGDKATITYGVSQAVVDDLRKTLNFKDGVIERLLKTLDEKDVAIQDRDTKLQELAKKYKELEERLAKRSAEDDLVAQAKKKLDVGDFEGAEKLLLQSLEKNIQNLAEKKMAAAASAFELGSLKELQLEYYSAKKYYEQAVKLEPENTDYLNRYGQILDTLGKHKEAIDYYEKALAIDLKGYGEQHPQVAILYNNLGSAWYSLGKYQKAIDYYEKALAILLKVFGEQHPDTQLVKSNLESLKKNITSSKKQ